MTASSSPRAAMPIRRRQCVASASAGWGAASHLPACAEGPDPEDHESVAAALRRAGSWHAEGAALSRELVRCATLAPSSHNTQCWRFTLEDKAITVRPDLARRCPAVDPDDHHLFVSPGCAVENLSQAALAHGLKAEASFDTHSNAVSVALAATAARSSPLFHAISLRQCTRGDYDGRPLSSEKLTLLFTAQRENDKYARQVRSSAGIAVFVGNVADKAHWVDVGRCHERFALQATALGIRSAFLNQPIEVPSLRAPFASAMGLAGQRPDLVVRFGRGPAMPFSLRRPVQTVVD